MKHTQKDRRTTGIRILTLLRCLPAGIVLMLLFSCNDRSGLEPSLTWCNPLDLDYRYQPDPPSRREAADPTLILFRNTYFLFASKTGGYWWSEDLAKWNLVETDEIPTEDYAPTAVVIGDTVYFMASSGRPGPIYKSADPRSGSWQIASDSFAFAVWDPAFFLDEDKRLYLYWGCSNTNPVYGVEVDYRNGFLPLGEPVECLNARPEIHGWERPGDRNELGRAPWIEGAWMNKHNGKYYLQYAAPGTEFKAYADGVYESVHPLGPFRYARHNPFSLKAGGFSCGAGHGNTFRDKHGNLWHIATVSISVNHMFERRLALFPAMFDEDSILYASTGFGDYPMVVPDHKFSGPEELFTGWMLLSYNKPVRASSSMDGYPPENVVDEEIRTAWCAKSGSAGEWICIDLGKEYEIRAVQLNFADIKGSRYSRDTACYYEYLLEHSADGTAWEQLDELSGKKQDSPHYYRQLEDPLSARFIRLSNVNFPNAYFALSGFRVFGRGDYEKPGKVYELIVARDQEDPAQVKLSWPKASHATGYNIRYGIAPGKLYHQHIVYDDTTLTLGSLNADARYYFSIEAFNESGISK